MVEFPHFPNAPIVEAMIDFRAKPPDGFNIESFKSLRSVLENDFPKMEERKSVQFQFQFPIAKPENQPASKQTDLGIAGYRFHSADGKYIAQFRRDGFTLNRLQPYPSWEEIFSKASGLWKLYDKTACPIEVSRIAVRYINRIRLPLPLADLQVYLRTLPVLAEGCPTHISGFVTRVIVHEPDLGIAANVTQVLESPPKEDYVPLILDIDVYQQGAFNDATEKLLARFAKLREMKNKIFFGSLTTKAIELFQ